MESQPVVMSSPPTILPSTQNNVTNENSDKLDMSTILNNKLNGEKRSAGFQQKKIMPVSTVAAPQRRRKITPAGTRAAPTLDQLAALKKEGPKGGFFEEDEEEED